MTSLVFEDGSAHPPSSHPSAIEINTYHHRLCHFINHNKNNIYRYQHSSSSTMVTPIRKSRLQRRRGPNKRKSTDAAPYQPPPSIYQPLHPDSSKGNYTAPPERFPRKRTFKKSRKAFPFLKFSYDIRRQIYDLCLTCPSTISISIDTSNGGNGLSNIDRTMPEEYDGLVELTSEQIRSIDQNKSKILPTVASTFNTSLLFVSRLVYMEAVSVMYSRNTFRFIGEEGLDAFVFFHRRLSEQSRACLRGLHLKLPFGVFLPNRTHWCRTTRTMEPYDNRQDDFVEWLVTTINGLPSLREFRLLVDQNLLDVRDVDILQGLFPGWGVEKRVTIEATKDCGKHGPSWRLHVHNNYNDHCFIRVHRDVVQIIREAGWLIVGEIYETE